MSPVARRRLLVAGVLATLVVVLLDVVGSGLPGRARSWAATAIGPVQRAVAGADRGQDARLAQENAVLRAELAQARGRLDEDAAAGRVLASASGGPGRLLAARVVGESVTATGGHQVTLDVGQRDGVEPNLTVVAAEGLVGRVVTVGAFTSDVRVVDGSDTAVAVRLGSGALGSVGATPPADRPARRPGELTLTLLEGSAAAPTVGDPVVTLGSVGGRPYAPGVAVGTVTAVDPPRGQQPRTAVVRTAVDTARLDVLAVLLPATPGAAPSAPPSPAPAAAALGAAS